MIRAYLVSSFLLQFSGFRRKNEKNSSANLDSPPLFSHFSTRNRKISRRKQDTRQALSNSTQEERWLLREKYFGVALPAYEDDKARLARGEPLAYVIGSVPFLNLKIDVSFRPHIPRVETEFWTEKVIATLKTDTRPNIRCLDLFSGSGCIGLAIAKNVSNVHVDLADNDVSCIEQIEKNITLNTIDTRRVRVFHSDLFSRVSGAYDLGRMHLDAIRGAKEREREAYFLYGERLSDDGNEGVRQVHASYDYIFANPPYIALKKTDCVAASVVQFEPHGALFGGDDGLAVIRAFLANALTHLNPGGRIFMEFDDTEYDTLQEILSKLRYTSVHFFKDQYDLWRFVELAVM